MGSHTSSPGNNSSDSSDEDVVHFAARRVREMQQHSQEAAYQMQLSEETTSGFRMTTMLVNFLLAEAKMVLLFLLGYRGVVQGAAYQFFMHRLREVSFHEMSIGNVTVAGVTVLPTAQHGYNNVPDFVDCVSSDISGALGALTLARVYEGECLVMRSPVPFGALTYPVVFCCALLLFVELSLLTKFYIQCCSNGLRSTFCAGRYLQFVWGMYESRAYTMVSHVLQSLALACAVLVLFLGAYFGNCLTFLSGQFMPLFGTIMGAVSFSQYYVPLYAKDNELFGKLVFNRNCLQMLTQSCSGFAADLNQALHRAAIFNDFSELESMIDYKQLGWSTFDTEARQGILEMITNLKGGMALPRDEKLSAE